MYNYNMINISMAAQIVSNYLNFDYNTRKYFNLNNDRDNN
jgi:hypothetical protein